MYTTYTITTKGRVEYVQVKVVDKKTIKVYDDKGDMLYEITNNGINISIQDLLSCSVYIINHNTLVPISIALDIFNTIGSLPAIEETP